MVKHKPKSWKGHCPLCKGLHRGIGWQLRVSGSELKRAYEGRNRRVKRNDVPPKEEW